MTETRMTKGERQELGQLIRKRERVLKQQAVERSAKLMAEFEAHAAQIYSFNDDDVWAKATEAAGEAVKAAQAMIADRCAELGIPAEFQPGISFGWHGRGSGAVSFRQAELRRKVKQSIEALEQEARAKIEAMSLAAQTEVIANGLESEAARTFLEKMPPLEALMPQVDVNAIRKLIERKPGQREQYLLGDYT